MSCAVAVCLAGFSPAVVTETLYALAVACRPRVIPKRVLILTTEDAFARVVSTLPGRNGAIRRLASEYGLPDDSLVCDTGDVIVLRSRAGRPLQDIRSSADSRDAGETIADLLHRLHSDPDVELHCSLAGGRKTLGALLALALQLCARPGDRLYHVLVNEPFENIPEFFYPPRKPRHYLLNGKRIDSRLARVDLAEIPLVRLGAVAASLGLEGADLARKAAAVEAAALKSIRPPRLVLDVAGRELHIGDTEIRLPPQEFSLYALYALLRAGCVSCKKRSAAGCAGCRITDAEVFDLYREKLLQIYEECGPASGSLFVSRLRDRSGGGDIRMEFDAWVRQIRSRLNRSLRTAKTINSGPYLVSLWKEGAPGARQGNRRGLLLLPEYISVSNVGGKKKNVEK